ncbi:MAG: hypothetical protein LBO69_05985 [Ignavibacteria bacterium]|nr:hypothetical protein [Ignavibacteria bacterium]
MAEKYYCKYCGSHYDSIAQLVGQNCYKNPDGKRHVLYEGSTQKKEYVCKHCGAHAGNIARLTGLTCPKNRNGNKHHEPAL